MRYHDERLRWLQENFSYIDSVTMIDATGKITVKERYNPRYSDAENAADNEWCLNRNLLEVFPSLSHSDSTLLQTLQKGELLYRENQCTINHSGKKSVTSNVTFPIISRGKIIGAVELSRDVTHYEGERTAPAARPTPKRRSGTEAKWTLEDIVTQNSKMLEIKRTIAKVADSRSSVLVYGETGTGKELIVSALHNAGSRKDQPFVAVNCAALPESILEGLLFGSQKGAFTGAENKKGMFAEANGGTIYLDEINSMPLLLQAKLLRVLQEKSVTPLGASKPIPLDVRIIASTNRPISEVVASGQMREDILYRINTISIQIPPLRRRLDDIPLLAAAFVEKYSAEMGKQVAGVAPEVTAFLMNRSWRGNVRELEHVIESAMNVVEDGQTVELEHLPIYLSEVDELEEDTPEHSPREAVSLNEALAAYEKKLILAAMKASNWKIVDAAARLRTAGMAEAVLEAAAAGKPVLGICLGMQLLLERSFEYGEHPGLGLIPGEVRPIRDVIPAGLAVPHMGWNALRFPAERPRSPIFAALEEGEHVYFVHSYAGFACGEGLTAWTEYGAPLTAAVQRGNVYGTQFHPEKSGDVGLRILKAFCGLEGEA